MHSNVEEFSAAEYATFKEFTAGGSRRSRGAIVLGAISMALVVVLGLTLLAGSAGRVVRQHFHKAR